MPQAGHSSHLAYGPHPFEGFLFPSQAPWVSQQVCSWLWFRECFPCNPRCQLDGRSRTEERDVGKRFLYLSVGFRQLKWFETWNHYVWMQFWPCDSILPSCHHVGLSGGNWHFCSDCLQGCSQLAFYTNDIALFQYCFHFHTWPRASQSWLFSQGPHASPFLTNCRVSTTPQCTHFAATVCTSTSQFPKLAPGSALQASMKCKVFI